MQPWALTADERHGQSLMELLVAGNAVCGTPKVHCEKVIV